MPSLTLDLVQHSILFPDWSIWKLSSCFGDENENRACGHPGSPGFGPAHLSSLRHHQVPTPSWFPSCFPTGTLSAPALQVSTSARNISLPPCSLDPVSGPQNNDSKDVHILTPKPVDMFGHIPNGEWRLQVELKLLISRPYNGKSVLDCLGGPTLITGFLKWGKGSPKSHDGEMAEWRRLPLLWPSLKKEERTTSQGMQAVSGSEKIQWNKFSPRASRKKHRPAGILILPQDSF